MDEHKHHFQLVFQCFKEYGVLTNPSKCELGVIDLNFLGYILNSQGLLPLQEKVTVFQEILLLPSTKHKLKEFLGFMNFYHH